VSEPPVPFPPVTLEEQAAFQRISWPIADVLEQGRLQEALDSAIGHVEKLVGPISLATRDYLVRPRRDKLVLPVTRLQAVVEVRDPAGNVVAPYDVNLLSGIVELTSEPATTKAWTVRATAGQDVVQLRRAVKIIASHLYEDHRGTGALPGGRTYPSGGEDTPAPMGFAIPRRAAELLAPYRRTGR